MIISQSIFRGEGNETFPIVTADTIVSTKPEAAIFILYDCPDMIISQAIFPGEGNETCSVITADTAAVSSKPKVAIFILNDGSYIIMS